jgi:hypothetical protein
VKNRLGLLGMFLTAVFPVLVLAAQPVTCPDSSMNGKGPTATYPCPSKVATAAPASSALVARANDATGAKAYWSAWGGVPATAFVWTDAGTWVAKSVLTAPAPAATGQAQIVWTASTTNTDGSAIAGAVTYRVYGGLAQPLTLKTTTATLSYLWIGLAPGTWLFSVSAVNGAGEESALSVPVTKVIKGAAPSTPPGVTVK